MQEIWKDVKDYEGLYQVSNLGRVRSLPRKGTRTKEKYLLKASKNKKGYLNLGLSKNRKAKSYTIHRLVSQAFIPNPDNLPQVNHIDGNKLNNCVDNLEWASHLEQNLYGTRMKRMKEKLYKKVNQYDLDGNFIKQWYCVRDIERELNFDNRNICACCRGKRPTAYGYKWKYNNKEE